ncbi:FeoA family protein [Collinsella tanakaei]|uniref:FeoA family protein n=1 Tax=Collinsella tanakaei TaxID=626935 RepID=UPI0025A3214A|nr:FeoA family protein [Collinsella tanakaei]MDM8245920.1 FeoA family protein [Collinsella tanakaei]
MTQGPRIPAMPLSLRHAGETVAVTRVRGDEDLKHHLANIGFVEGSQVHVVSASASNIIVVVKGARFGLDAKVAQHVMTA